MSKTPQEVANFLGKYVAMQPDGKWFWFDEKPIITEIPYGSFWGSYKRLFELPSDFIKYDGRWRDSLHEPQEALDADSKG
jgi:hypothetical protein